MELGMHLREVARLRAALLPGLLLALFVAVSATHKVSVFPPGVAPRQLEMATASTRVLVDTSKSLVLDIRYGSGDFESLTARGVLLGNLMASAPVRGYIARRAGIPADVIQATTPLTPDFPRPRAGEGRAKSQRDLLRSTDEYRLNIQANPTVPILHVFAQAPDAAQAEHLANGAVDGLGDYLAEAVRRSGAPGGAEQPQLTQLGRARGTTINEGARIQAFVLAFVLAFALCCAATVFLHRVRRGWAIAGDVDGALPGGAR